LPFQPPLIEFKDLYGLCYLESFVIHSDRGDNSYFKRRKLIANQIIEKELADGRLLISAKIGHENQVLPIIRYWIPHIKVISPEAWQDDLENELDDYLRQSVD
jgi:predicted DNA-binding transcriptional regulator YafY